MKSFKQQQLSAWQPVLTPVSVIAMLLIVFVIFLPIGILLEDCSNRVVEQSVRYDNVGDCDLVTNDLNYTELPKLCDFQFELQHDYEVPIYFYYELKNFYQNHRRYSDSKSDAQLRGDSNPDLADCDPLETDDNGDDLVPCGLFAASFFEDRFTMEYQLPTESQFIPLCDYEHESDPCYFYSAGETESWNENWANFSNEGMWEKDGIAWDSDIESKFKFVALSDGQSNIGPRQKQSGLNLPDVDDEDFIVWMRAAALPNFRKLHRVIRELPNAQTVLSAGTVVSIRIASWFPTKDFDGEKWITVAKTEWCGGENHALAWTYIVVAAAAILLTVTFAILLLFGTRKMANVHQFTWHNLGARDPMMAAR